MIPMWKEGGILRFMYSYNHLSGHLQVWQFHLPSHQAPQLPNLSAISCEVDPSLGPCESRVRIHLRADVEGQSLGRGHLNGCAPCAAAWLLRLARLQAGEPLLPGACAKLCQGPCSAVVEYLDNMLCSNPKA